MKKRNTRGYTRPVYFSLFVLSLIALSGCATLGHQTFYRHAAPEKYAPTNNVHIFQYTNVDIHDLYDLLFSDFMIIGDSSFNGPYENPSSSTEFAREIGADVFIVATQFAETRTSLIPLVTPSMSTTTISGFSGRGSFYGTATSYGTSVTTVPITVHRYDQKGMYLKNLNKVVPLWERAKQDYKKTEDNILQGIWHNESYEIDVFLSGTQVVGFVSKLKKNNPDWRVGDLKMIFNPQTGTGIYLMGDKTPIPSTIALNKFGHLEVKLITQKHRFSFARN